MDFHEIYFQIDDNEKFKLSDYGFYAVEVPYPGAPEIKEPYKNEWYDEDGDDEYIPTESHFKAQEFSATLASKGTNGQFTDDLRLLLTQLKGKEFLFFSEYGHWGRQKVHYVSYETDAYHHDDLLVFKLNFKVNDPVTSIGIYHRMGSWVLYQDGNVI